MCEKIFSLHPLVSIQLSPK